MYTAPGLRERLIELVERGRTRVAVDMEGVEFMDSTGLGVLVSVLKRIREHDGTLALVGTRDPVRKVLSVTGLDRVFSVHDTLDQAMA